MFSLIILDKLYNFEKLFELFSSFESFLFFLLIIIARTRSLTNYFNFQGILTYGKYGLIIDILTNIFSRISTLKSNPIETIKSIISDFNLRFFKFLVLYSGLYKVSI